jgi:hypothetical protein
MSRRRIYVNGKPDRAENEPGFRGRVSGYGQGNLHAMTLIGGMSEMTVQRVTETSENQGVKPTESRRFRS